MSPQLRSHLDVESCTARQRMYVPDVTDYDRHLRMQDISNLQLELLTLPDLVLRQRCQEQEEPQVDHLLASPPGEALD